MNYLSREEDRKFSILVHQFNGESDMGEKKMAMESEIRDRVSVLLYMIPRSYSLVPETENAGFYLEMAGNVDNIIAGYDISKASFNTYLTSICRYKAMAYLKKQNGNRFTSHALENSLAESEFYVKKRENRTDGSCYESRIKSPEASYGPAEIRKSFERMDMGETASYIIESAGTPVKNLDKKERLLSIRLEDKRERRAFLAMILSIAGDIQAVTVAGLSRVLSVEAESIEHLLTLKEDAVSQRYPAMEKLKDLSSKYWRAMSKLKISIALEGDNHVKKKELVKRYNEIERRFEIVTKKISEASRGLPKPMIADVLGISKSTVATDISKMLKYLESLDSLS